MSGYHAPVADFLADDVDRVVGLLARTVADTGIVAQSSRQITVWQEQTVVLRRNLQRLAHKLGDAIGDWHIALEYELPRRQKRPDAIILANDRILVIEFKFGMAIVCFETARRPTETFALMLWRIFP